eukprot:TRINITY_DN14087_c0_g1_i7.p2 TRINITY_DN14087_c0_g1~~TRINITY_DN14087_c0_g1_i7.p2  ORF type:complete len:111 (-),score=13.11 TRINITY_DN14087_c0_g1_i7:183-515(-)
MPTDGGHPPPTGPTIAAQLDALRVCWREGKHMTSLADRLADALIMKRDAQERVAEFPGTEWLMGQDVRVLCRISGSTVGVVDPQNLGSAVTGPGPGVFISNVSARGGGGV